MSFTLHCNLQHPFLFIFINGMGEYSVRFNGKINYNKALASCLSLKLNGVNGIQRLHF